MGRGLENTIANFCYGCYTRVYTVVTAYKLLIS